MACFPGFTRMFWYTFSVALFYRHGHIQTCKINAPIMVATAIRIMALYQSVHSVVCLSYTIVVGCDYSVCIWELHGVLHAQVIIHLLMGLKGSKCMRNHWNGWTIGMGLVDSVDLCLECWWEGGNCSHDLL